MSEPEGMQAILNVLDAVRLDREIVDIINNLPSVVVHCYKYGRDLADRLNRDAPHLLLPVLTEAMTYNSNLVRITAAVALGGLGRDGLKLILESLYDDDPVVREYAVNSINAFDDNFTVAGWRLLEIARKSPYDDSIASYDALTNLFRSIYFRGGDYKYKTRQSFLNAVEKHLSLSESERIKATKYTDLLEQEIASARIPSNEESFEDKLRRLSGLSLKFRERIAEELAPSLNARIQSMPQKTLVHKNAICEFVVQALEPLGIAVKSPKTGLPARLVTGLGGQHENGLFEFHVTNPGGKPSCTDSKDTLPILELIDAAWQQDHTVQLKPVSLSDAIRQIIAENSSHREKVAKELTPKLNVYVRTMPHETYAEKKELARFVNDLLDPLGLALREPKTGLPGKLRAQTGNWSRVGRFAIEIYEGGRRKTPSVSDALPELKLMDGSALSDPESYWQQLVGGSIDRKGNAR